MKMILCTSSLTEINVGNLSILFTKELGALNTKHRLLKLRASIAKLAAKHKFKEICMQDYIRNTEFPVAKQFSKA